MVKEIAYFPCLTSLDLGACEEKSGVVDTMSAHNRSEFANPLGFTEFQGWDLGVDEIVFLHKVPNFTFVKHHYTMLMMLRVIHLRQAL